MPPQFFLVNDVPRKRGPVLPRSYLSIAAGPALQPCAHVLVASCIAVSPRLLFQFAACAADEYAEHERSIYSSLHIIIGLINHRISSSGLWDFFRLFFVELCTFLVLLFDLIIRLPHSFC